MFKAKVIYWLFIMLLLFSCVFNYAGQKRKDVKSSLDLQEEIKRLEEENAMLQEQLRHLREGDSNVEND